jgi:adenosine deaminase
MKPRITLEEIQRLPKIDLHRHLDGAVKPSLLFQLAKKDGFALPVKDLEGLRKHFQVTKEMSLAEILAKFKLVIDLMQTPENLQKVAYEQVMGLAKENIVYAELRFAPQYHTEQGLSHEEVMANVLEGFKKGYEETGVITNLIVCIDRACEPELGCQIARSALSFQDKGVVALDLACDEASWPPERHKSAFELVFDSRLGQTVHAGEFGNQRLKNIAAAIDLLRADRLGHAIVLPKDDQLLEKVRARRIGVECCPLSNLVCSLIKDLKELCLDKYLAKGILFSINSDDPAMFDKTLSDNLLAVCQSYGWGKQELEKIFTNSLEMAFMTNYQKTKLKLFE